MSRVVLDASALIAWLHKEPGHKVVDDNLDEACICAVNLSETVAKEIEYGGTLETILGELQNLGIEVFDFTEDDCMVAASLREQTRHLGLSLGDRACLALGHRLQVPVITAEKNWNEFESNLKVVLIR